MANKYTVKENSDQAILYKDGKIIARFWNDYPNNVTNAQKVCDLLNEVSRSQGKWPMRYPHG